MTSSFSSVIERLEARNKERIDKAALSKKELDSTPTNESASAFLADFRRQHLQLEADIVTYNGSDASVAISLETRIADLEKSLASASYFLPLYDLRSATAAVATLKSTWESTLYAKQPRKKFSFASKKKEKEKEKIGNANVQEHGSKVDDATSLDSGHPTPGNTEGIDNIGTTGAPTPTLLDHSARVSGITLRGLRNQTITLPDTTTNQLQATDTVSLMDLDHCTVRLFSPLGALFIHSLNNCTIIAGPVHGAVHLENLQDCTIYLAAHQVRIHSTHRCDFYLRVRSGPIIEHSTSLRFGPLHTSQVLVYEGVEDRLREAGLEDEGRKEWQLVSDFGWLKTTPSPHWTLMNVE